MTKEEFARLDTAVNILNELLPKLKKEMTTDGTEKANNIGATDDIGSMDLYELVRLRGASIRLLNVVKHSLYLGKSGQMPTIPVSQFVHEYSVHEFSKFRNCGTRSVTELKDILDGVGIRWE